MDGASVAAEGGGGNGNFRQKCISVSYYHGSLRLPHPPRYQVFQEVAGLTEGILNHPGRFLRLTTHLQASPTFFKKGRHDLKHPPPGKKHVPSTNLQGLLTTIVS